MVVRLSPDPGDPARLGSLAYHDAGKEREGNWNVCKKLEILKKSIWQVVATYWAWNFEIVTPEWGYLVVGQKYTWSMDKVRSGPNLIKLLGAYLGT